MAAQRDPRMKRWLETTDHDVAVKQERGIPHEATGLEPQYVYTNLVAMPSQSNPERTVTFATNRSVRDEIGYDRNRTVEKVGEYSKRSEQEKCYEKVKGRLPPTESKSFRLHLLYFLFACVAYAMWRLVDFRVKRDTGRDIDEKPVVEFVEFLETVRDFLFNGG